MSINIPRGPSDEGLKAMIDGALRPYESDHPQAQIDLYRQNPVSVRIRIIDPDFAGHSRPERSQQAWQYLERLPEEVASDISSLLLLTPEETRTSFANMEFEDPVPSQLFGDST